MGNILYIKSKHATAAVFSLLAFFSAPSAGFADDFGTGTGDTGPFADSSLHYWCEDGLNYVPAWYDPIADAMTYLETHTDMTTLHVSQCAQTTDIWYKVENLDYLGVGVRGFSACRLWTDIANTCDSFWLRIDSDLPTYTQRRKTSCHEVGHTVGLSHASAGDDCMISGNYGYLGYNAHHVAHINSKY